MAAGNQERFWEIHEKLYANQEELIDARVEAIGRELGLNMEQFNRDLKDPAIGSLIDKDISDGRQANIINTPLSSLLGNSSISQVLYRPSKPN